MPGLIDTEEGARRFARTIVSDLLEYNEEKVERGIRDDNLFEILAGEIEKGRAYYRSRVHPRIYTTTNFFDLALVDVLFKQKGDVKSRIW